MADERVLEGMALRRAVAEAQGWRVVDVGDGYWRCERDVVTYRGLRGKIHTTIDAETKDEAWTRLCELDYFKPYETDLNTLKDAAAMLQPGVSLEIELFITGKASAIITASNHETGFVDELYFTRCTHTEPATAAWNTVLRWKAREQEAGDESVK